MNVKTLCLAILYDGDVTGYDIRKMAAEGEYGYFVEASFGAIYPALAKLEADGHVSSRIEQQDGKPAKKIYRITDTGRAEFQNELFESLTTDVFRSEFLLFARFAYLLPEELVQNRIDGQMADFDDQLAHIEKLRKDNDHPGENWVLNHGCCCLTAARDHLIKHSSKLLAMAKPAADAAE